MFIAIVAVALAELPITDVTVFSDRARVTRSGSVAVSGRQRIELVTLGDTTDTASLNVEASGAELENVEILPLDEEQLPVTEVKAVLKALEENSDATAKNLAELSAIQAQVSQLQSLSPSLPSNGANAPPPRLSSAGWNAALAFSADQLSKLQAKERELVVKRDALTDKREELEAKASLLGGAQRRSGWKIAATAKGSGPARFSVTYVAMRARWVPTYDVQLQPDSGKVQVSFAGLVSQETGEDWAEAALTLSTAVPSQATEFPKLLTWKIGTRERFIPTPAPVAEVVRPAPVAPPLVAVPREEDVLRAELAMRLGVASADKAKVALETERSRYADQNRRAAEEKRPMVRGFAGNAPAAAPPPPPEAPAPAPAKDMDFSGDEMAGAAVQEESVRYETQSLSSSSKRSSRPAERQVPMSLAPPAAWVRPVFSPELPAAAGGGYDLAWPSLQRESIASGKGARRVALFTQTWPVTTERKLYPALFSESFLVAELKNPATWPLPAGTANLYVGADPAGTAVLKLVSPGEKFTLPLGIDRALKPVRNVKVVDAEKGVFSKDDFSEYSVTIQLANPYRTAVAVRLYDQVPVTDDKEVEIALVETKPQATHDKVRGHLEWRLNVAPGAKTEVSFKYTLKRPKGWRMNQWEVQQ